MWLHNKPKLWHLSDTWKVSFFVLDSPVNKVRKVARRQKNYTGAALWCSLQFVLCHPHRVGPAHGWFSMFLMLNGPKKQEKKGGVHYLSMSQYTAHTRPWTTSFHYVPWWAETSGRRDHNVRDYSVDALVHTGKHQWSPAEYAAFAGNVEQKRASWVSLAVCISFWNVGVWARPAPGWRQQQRSSGFGPPPSQDLEAPRFSLQCPCTGLAATSLQGPPTESMSQWIQHVQSQSL